MLTIFQGSDARREDKLENLSSYDKDFLEETLLYVQVDVLLFQGKSNHYTYDSMKYANRQLLVHDG